MKNQSKEIKYLKPHFLTKNLKSIEGDLPRALRMSPGSKFFFLYNRYKVNSFFQTGVQPGFCKLEEIQKKILK